MNSLFDPQNLFFRSLAWAVDVIGISLFWAILCLPVITIVPATAALYHTAALCICRGEKGAFTRFFRSFLRNLKQGCLLSIPLVVLGAMLFWGQNVMAAASTYLGGGATVLYGIYSVLLVLPLGVVCWGIPLLGRFDFKSGELVRTSFILAVGHLPTTVVSVLLVCGGGFLCLLLLPLLLVLPALTGVILSVLMERVFRRYYPAA
ncbi:MAG: YesL family protein [Angelakisella sp.]|jgi:uncharacterized membrane protein YesL|nr:YesL family protein [Angelakisella sp.]